MAENEKTRENQPVAGDAMPKKKKGCGLRCFVILAVLIVLVLGGLFAAKEIYLKSFVIQWRDSINQKLGKAGRITIESYKVSIFGRFEIHGLDVLTGDGCKEKALSVEEVSGSVSILSALNGKTSLKSMVLWKPQLSMRVNPDGSTNWDGIIDNLRGPKGQDGMKIGSLAIRNGRMDITRKFPDGRNKSYQFDNVTAVLYGITDNSFHGTVKNIDIAPDAKISGEFDRKQGFPAARIKIQQKDSRWLARALMIPDGNLNYLPRGELVLNATVSLKKDAWAVDFETMKSGARWKGMALKEIKGSGTISPSTVNLKSFAAKIEKGNITGNILIQRTGPMPLRAELRTFNIPIERWLPPEVVWSGTVATELILEGNLKDLKGIKALGRIRIEDARLELPKVPMGDMDSPFVLLFDDLRGSFLWDSDKLEIEQLNFQGDQGRLEISGFVSNFLNDQGEFDPGNVAFALDVSGHGDEVSKWLGTGGKHKPPIRGAYALSLHLDTGRGSLEKLSGEGELRLDRGSVLNPYALAKSPEFLKQIDVESFLIQLKIPLGRGVINVNPLELKGKLFKELQARGQVGFTGGLSLGGSAVPEPELARSLISGAGESSGLTGDSMPMRFTVRGTLKAPVTQWASEGN